MQMMQFIVVRSSEKKSSLNRKSNVLNCIFIGRQSGMTARMPPPLNQLFNDESIAVHIFKCLYLELAMHLLAQRITW